MTDRRLSSWLWIVLCALVLPAACHAAPDTAWTFRYAPVADVDYQPLASFVDDTGNVYVAGWAGNDEADRGVFLLKIDSLGHLVWHTSYDNATAAGAARDTSGNIYIAAVARGASSNGKVCLLKYKPNGDREWVQIYGEAADDYQPFGSIAIDDGQNVYACGWVRSASSTVVRILKYLPGGMLESAMSYTLRAGMFLRYGQFHILGSGEAYLALSVERPTDSCPWNYDWFVAKLSREGLVLWERIYNETSEKFERLDWSCVDDKANIYLTGDVVSSVSGSDDFCTMKMDSSGNALWTKEYNGPENLRDEPQFLMLDGQDVYVAGWSEYDEESEAHAITLAKYDSAGDQLWVSRYGGADTTCDLGYDDLTGRPDFRSMNIDGRGNVYLTGSGVRSGLFSVLLKYGPQGDPIRDRTRVVPGEGWQGALVDFASNGAPYDIGTATPIGGHYSVYVVKYRGGDE